MRSIIGSLCPKEDLTVRTTTQGLWGATCSTRPATWGKDVSKPTLALGT